MPTEKLSHSGARNGISDLHKELCRIGASWLRGTNHSVVIGGLTTYSCEIPDVIGWRDVSTLIECKASVNDYKLDCLKLSRRTPGLAIGFYRFYLVPEGMIKPEDVPDPWGLLYRINSRLVNTAKKPIECPDRNLESECRILVSALRRMRLHMGTEEFGKTLKYAMEEDANG